MLGALEGCNKKLLFAEPCGLENTHNAIMRVHYLMVGTSNKRAQTHGNPFQ